MYVYNICLQILRSFRWTISRSCCPNTTFTSSSWDLKMQAIRQSTDCAPMCTALIKRHVSIFLTCLKPTTLSQRQSKKWPKHVAGIILCPISGSEKSILGTSVVSGPYHGDQFLVLCWIVFQDSAKVPIFFTIKKIIGQFVIFLVVCPPKKRPPQVYFQ